MRFKLLLMTILMLWSSSALTQVPTSNDIKAEVVAMVALYREGKLTEAIRGFEALYQKAPDDPDVLGWLGFLYLRSDDAAKAIPLLEKVATLRPNSLDVLNNLGNAYLLSGNLDRALLQYQAVAVLDRKAYEPFYNIGNIELKRKNYDKAIGAYRTALTNRPNDPFALNNCGLAYEGKGDIASASDFYINAAKQRPDIVQFSKNAAFALVKLRRDAESVPWLNLARKGDPTDLETARTLSEILARAGRKREALDLLESLSDALSQNAAYWYNVGVLRSSLGKKAESEQAYEKALKIDPDDVDTLNNLGLLQFERGGFADAIVTFEKLHGVNPKSTTVKINLASAYARSGEQSKAIPLWKEIINQDPSRKAVRLDLANALWKTGERESAKQHYLHVLTTDKTNAVALNGIGLWYLEQSRLSEAERSFRGAMAANTKFLPAYNNLAVTLERLNKKRDAIQILERALRIDPNYIDAKKNLARMKSEG